MSGGESGPWPGPVGEGGQQRVNHQGVGRPSRPTFKGRKNLLRPCISAVGLCEDVLKDLS